jgi:hypothetical protein
MFSRAAHTGETQLFFLSELMAHDKGHYESHSYQGHFSPNKDLMGSSAQISPEAITYQGRQTTYIPHWKPPPQGCLLIYTLPGGLCY